MALVHPLELSHYTAARDKRHKLGDNGAYLWGMEPEELAQAISFNLICSNSNFITENLSKWLDLGGYGKTGVLNEPVPGRLRRPSGVPTLFRHFNEEAQGQAGSVYGRQMYEVMRYWDDDHSEWDAEERAFAVAWRNQPKSVVSRSLKSVGPNAILIENDLEGAIRQLKAEYEGEIEVAGPNLAQSLTELGLIDEYRL